MEMRKTTADGLEPTVLEDASGRRARWMRRTGRLVYLLFLAWLVAIVLGGLGLTPVPRIPFAHALRLSQGPPQLAQMPRPRPPSASDLRSALPASALAAHGGSGRAAGQTRAQARGRSSSAPGHGTVPRGRSSTAPGQTKTTPSNRGRSTTAPGHTKTNPSGLHRKVPPGRTRRTTTTTTSVPPGQTRTTTTPGPRGKR
jgi:hypothetical protein